MKITLKNLKIAKFASEETLCFRCTVYVDGVRAGEASNDGRGGANRYEPRALYDTLAAYAATLPPWTAYGQTSPHTADTAFGAILDQHEAEKAFARTLQKRVVLIKEDGKLYTASVPKESDLTKAIAHFVGRTGIKAVLNTLPTDEAMALWMTAHKDPN